VGGSADLASSNKTALDGGGSVERRQFGGRNLHFGVREHAMGAILNGMTLHRGFRVFGATFLIFSDYMRAAIRLAALTELPVTYVFTHDSFYLGEDGPTHQPIEHLASLRAMPNLVLIRPADAVETVEAWEAALTHADGPVALVLSRQDLRILDHSRRSPGAGLARGAYVLREAQGGTPELILLASGSEVELAVDAATELEKDGIPTRVVSFPSWELFAAQPADYQAAVLPPGITARVAIEAASAFGWERYVGISGMVVGIDHFGASAPAKVLGREFGFTVERVVAAGRQVLSGRAAATRS
jgi:transketolase